MTIRPLQKHIYIPLSSSVIERSGVRSCIAETSRTGSINHTDLDEALGKNIFSEIDAYAPNFSSSVIGYEVLPPPDIEKIFGLTGGNIFHGSMSLDQLYFTRPVSRYSNYTTPIKGLYLCGSGAHPGGGVTGAPGRLAASILLLYAEYTVDKAINGN
ncbi:unnamed protein product [Strongylus vulgaris]|uniref:Amine oxidase domain-containing protein n=1 Tax=Strongylus vulgaris TaxID=40348 RepID=A0A3P7JKJ1_STRVU|nr:unnamed protein product [Strongylus vulgaris]